MREINQDLDAEHLSPKNLSCPEKQFHLDRTINWGNNPMHYTFVARRLSEDDLDRHPIEIRTPRPVAGNAS